MADAPFDLDRYAAYANVKDSGEKQKFETGAQRDTRTGKGRFDLLPPHAMLRLARHFESGAVKYGDRNWEKGQPTSRYLDSALRHIFSFLDGDRSEDHLAAAAWNVLCCIETEYRIFAGRLPMTLFDLPNLTTGQTTDPTTFSDTSEGSQP